MAAVNTPRFFSFFAGAALSSGPAAVAVNVAVVWVVAELVAVRRAGGGRLCREEDETERSVVTRRCGHFSGALVEVGVVVVVVDVVAMSTSGVRERG